MVPSNTVLDRGPVPTGMKIWGSEPQFTAMPLIAKLVWILLLGSKAESDSVYSDTLP